MEDFAERSWIARRRLVEWVQNEIVVYPDFHKRILFSNKAYFRLSSYVNKQKCRISIEYITQVHVEKLLDFKKLTI